MAPSMPERDAVVSKETRQLFGGRQGLTDEGNVDLWPYDRKTMARMLAAPDDRDYHVTLAVPAT